MSIFSDAYFLANRHSDRDAVLVGGQFLDALISKDKQWLWKYFPSRLGRQFISYYLTFGNHTRFVEHTGYYCSYRWKKKLKKKLITLLEEHATAKAEGNFELVAKIEMGLR